MSNHSALTARGGDSPFSHKSVISIAHEQNIICSKTVICRQLFAGHLVGSRPMKRKDKIHQMIIKGSTTAREEGPMLWVMSSCAEREGSLGAKGGSPTKNPRVSGTPKPW